MSGERIVSGSEERGFSPHESRLELEECLDHVFCGDACRVLARLPEQSVQCIVTSPPYFGHRVYTQHENPQEIGRETAVTDYIERLIRCLSQARQVLRDDGTLWLNLGDTYRKGVLQGVPWRVALRLCGLGWVLRSDIIWQKPNAMPASVTTRPTPDHEYLFLFSKAANTTTMPMPSGNRTSHSRTIARCEGVAAISASGTGRRSKARMPAI